MSNCPLAEEIIRVDDQCINGLLDTLQPAFQGSLDVYNQEVEAAEAQRAQDKIQLAKDINRRSVQKFVPRFRSKYCPGGCPIENGVIAIGRNSFTEFTEEWVEGVLRKELTPEEASRRVEIDSTFKEAVAEAKAALEEADAQFCPELVVNATSCFKCARCDASDPDIQCCENSDCGNNTIFSCVSNTCVGRGLPRFSLTWFGDDDLDLHVITPGGVEIDYTDTFDPVSGGELDADDIPEVVDLYVENIVFPNTAPLGNYTFFVDPFTIVGEPDSWELEIYMDPGLVASYSGSASDDPVIRFTFELIANATVETNCSGIPSGGDSILPGVGCGQVEDQPDLSFSDVVVSFEDLLGGTSKVQRVIFVDVDLIPRTKAYKEDPIWWQYYRSFWNEEGTEFVGDGELFEMGIVREDCSGLDWYEKDTIALRSDYGDLFSTRYCIPVSEKNTNEYCDVYLANHFRGSVGRLVPGVFTLGPTYYDPDSSHSGVAMNFQIFLDEFVQTSTEDFRCYPSGFWRTVIPGEVTREGWGIIPQTAEPQGRTDAPFLQWLWIVPKGKSVRVGKCLPTAVNCTETALNVGDALILDPPLSQISDEERERREREKFLRMFQNGASLGKVGELIKKIKETRMRNSDKEAIGFYYQYKNFQKRPPKWERKFEPLSEKNFERVTDLIRKCNCLTINGSGNRLEEGLHSGTLMADEAGRTENVHFYMPVSADPISYLIDNKFSPVPAILGSLADWAFSQGIQMDFRGHSWSGWYLWRACAEYSVTKCRSQTVTTYAPATMPEFWVDLRLHLGEFEGTGNVVYGNKDPLSIPSLGISIVTGGLGGNVDGKVVDAGHGLKDILDNCSNCRMLSPFHLHISPANNAASASVNTAP